MIALIADERIRVDPKQFGKLLQLEPAPEPEVLQPGPERYRRNQEVIRIALGLRESLLEARGQKWENASQDPRVRFAGFVPLKSRDGVVAQPALSA